MRARPSSQEDAPRGPIEIIDDAVHLLRRMPAGVLACYYTGSIPFVAAFLYFWTDMTRSSFASGYAGVAALALLAIYVWMLCWQTVFAVEAMAKLSGSGPPRWTTGRVLRMAVVQATIQPTKFIVLAISALVVLPLGWSYAFYQTAGVTGDGTVGDVRRAVARAWRQTELWPRENHLTLGVLHLLYLCVFLNVFVLLFVVPGLLKSLFGIELAIVLNLTTFANTTVWAVALATTYLLVNPLIRTVYTIRCFHGTAATSGEDLKASLRDLSRERWRRRLTAALLALPVILASGAGADRRAGAIPPPELDSAIREVLSRPVHSWKLPRVELGEEQEWPSWLERWWGKASGALDALVGWLERGARRLGKWLDKQIRRLIRALPEEEQSDIGWIPWMQGVAFVLLAGLAGLAAVWLYRIWRVAQRGGRGTIATLTPVVDISSEDTTADQLPVEEWLARAGELGGRGEWRLALRALHFSILVHLSRAELVTLARWKSRREYVKELERRAPERKELVRVFERNVREYERAWYGMYEVPVEKVEQAYVDLEMVRAG